jgi:hypothetical protein
MAMRNYGIFRLKFAIVTKFSWFLFISRHYCIGGLPGQANLDF